MQDLGAIHLSRSWCVGRIVHRRSEVCTGFGCVFLPLLGDRVLSSYQTVILSGSEIYDGYSNGDLLRFALQMNGQTRYFRLTSPHRSNNDDSARGVCSRIPMDATDGKASRGDRADSEHTKSVRFQRYVVGDTLSNLPDFRTDHQIFLHIIPSSGPVPGIKPIRDTSASPPSWIGIGTIGIFIH